MHETGIVQDLVRRVQHLAEDAGAERVSTVVVWLGALSQFSPQHFREHFDDAVRDSPVAGARLDIEASEDVHHPHAQDVMLQSVDIDVPESRE